MLQADQTLAINLIRVLLAYYHLLYNISTVKYSKDNKNIKCFAVKEGRVAT